MENKSLKQAASYLFRLSIKKTIKEKMKKDGVSITELSRAADLNGEDIDRILSVDEKATLHATAAALGCLGYELTLKGDDKQ